MVKIHTSSHDRLARAARSSQQAHDGHAAALSSTFNSAAIGMGWQLAIVVLIPIMGGYKLDDYFGRSPLLTICGLLIAAAGSIVVIKHALTTMNNFQVEPKPANGHKNEDERATK